jgi:hypothetical protein
MAIWHFERLRNNMVKMKEQCKMELLFYALAPD